MIDPAQFPTFLRALAKVAYVAYSTGVGGFALWVAVLDIFEVRSINLSTETIALMGIALIAPLIPFVRRLSLPGGPIIEFNRPRADRIIVTTESGIDPALKQIADLDREKLFGLGLPGDTD